MSGTPTVTASGGMFTVTDAQGNKTTVDLGTLMMMLNLERTENLDNQIAVQMQEIMDRNTQIEQLTELMMWARDQKANGKNDQNVTINGVTKPAATWAAELGVPWVDPGPKPSKSDDIDAWNAKWDTNIQNIKSQLDMLNNDSQVANIELQNLLEKRGNAFEMATKVMDTNNQSVQSILRNL
ncbi:MAG: hypothetical protein FWG74_03990 [Planctomycetes bacterium]|nr:hypothetical protein [Planctomycetota bacterium]